MPGTPAQLRLFESTDLFEFGDRGPDVYLLDLMTQGNSLLSTLFIKTIDPGATITVEYFDRGAGRDQGEAFLVATHGPFVAADIPLSPPYLSNKQIVTRCHDKPFVRLTISGGNVACGLYITVVNDFPFNANVRDAQDASLETDGGLPISVYDPTEGKFYFLRGDHGLLNFNATITEPAGNTRTGTQVVDQGEEPSFFWTVPALKTWKLRYAEVASRGFGRWQLFVDGDRKAFGVTSSIHEHDRVDLPGFIQASAGEVIELRYLYSYGPSDIQVDAAIGFSEI